MPKKNPIPARIRITVKKVSNIAITGGSFLSRNLHAGYNKNEKNIAKAMGTSILLATYIRAIVNVKTIAAWAKPVKDI